ncbi:MAG: polysaccharide biosynthesis C-terminal domain-containing protein [Xanthomonadales bacterium]|nr:polysaccharide biosynthesis C-terminal domain-containing protein [Xanthomonadales bacterium]
MNVLALPAASLVQAGDRPGLQARSAVLAMLLNLLLSCALIQVWGATGAAIGTAVAACAGAALLISAAHDHCGQSLASTLTMVLRYWPLAAVCLLCAWLFQSGFAYWLSVQGAEVREARALRWSAAAWSLLGYVVCVVAMLSLQLRRDASLRGQWRRWRSARKQPHEQPSRR